MFFAFCSRSTALMLTWSVLALNLLAWNVYAQTTTVSSPPPQPKCGFFGISSAVMKRLAGGRIADDRPALHTMALSPTERFAVYYDTSGINAVSLLDANHNSIPDYVDSVGIFFDFAYNAEIANMGYAAPPLADTIRLQATRKAVYSIYLLNLADDGFYGITHPVEHIGSGGQRGRFTSYIVMDNNYSPLDSTDRTGTRRRCYYTSGMNALKITAVHEFHHAIQLGSYGDSYTQCALHELTSTWLEYRLYPDVRDYEQFLPTLFSTALIIGMPRFGDGECLSGYVFATFGQYLYAQFGDRALRRMWERTATGTAPYQALDEVIAELSGGRLSLAAVWCGFSEWLYYTGSRALLTEQANRFANADRFPMLAFAREERFTPPSASASLDLKPLETRFLRFLLPLNVSRMTIDTLDIGYASPFSASTQQEYRLDALIQVSGSDKTPVVNGTNYSALLQTNNQATCSYLFLNGKPVTLVTPPLSVFPNPFSPQHDEFITFPQPQGIQHTDNLVLNIYTVDMTLLYSINAAASGVLRWNGITSGGERIRQGVYIYTLEWSAGRSIGKFVVSNY